MKKLTCGLILCIHNSKEAQIAEKAGAQALYYESFGDWKSDIEQIRFIQKKVKIPIIHQIRTGHSIEAQIFNHLKIDILDESFPFGISPLEKKEYKSGFMTQAEDFWEAMDKVKNGYEYLRTKIKKEHSLQETFVQLQKIQNEIQNIKTLNHEELVLLAQEKDIRLEILQDIKKNHFLPVRYFAVVGNLSLPDANLLKKHGADGLIIEHDIFEEESYPEIKIKKIKEAFEARSVGKLLELLEK